MYICICNEITDSDISDAVDDGVRNLLQLRQITGCSSGCGSCKELAAEVLQQILAEKRETQSYLPVMHIA